MTRKMDLSDRGLKIAVMKKFNKIEENLEKRQFSELKSTINK